MHLPESNADKGASPEDWFHFDMVLGLGSNLLPCVPSSDGVKVLAGSALAGKVGKIPSQFNHAGEAHGLKDWQKRDIMSNEVAAWSKDRRLNLCIRLGSRSHIYAFDVDTDSDLAGMVRSDITTALGFELPARSRANSKKILLAFRMDEVCRKRIIKTKDGRIELLAEGQQFVAAGSHSSGARYHWLPGLPDQIPTLNMEQVNSIWETLTKTYAIPGSTKDPQTAQEKTADEPQNHELLTEISDTDWAELIEALRFLLPHAADNDTWSEIGYALLSIRNQPAEQLWLQFSQKAPNYSPGAPEAWWDSHKAQTPRTDYRHIFTMARERGRQKVADPAAFPLVASEPDNSDLTGEPPAPDISVVPDTPFRPTIRLSDDRYSDIIHQIEDLLIPEVFVQGTHLTYRSAAHSDKLISRPGDALMLVEATREWLMMKLDEIADWQKYVKADMAWVRTKPSFEHVNAVFNLRSWQKLRPLDAIARAPFVREDGSINDVPGYDHKSRVLYVPSAEFPPIPDSPGHRDAFEALERIRGVFDQFPWKERASESTFLSHILAEAARLAINHCPMYFYDAPDAGTGKSLLQEMAARIVHGTDVSVRTWVGDGDEIRKVLYAALLAGDRSMWFDNIPDGTKVRSHEMCGFLTSANWSDRKLGESASRGIANRMVLVGSGNNITPSGDLARRSLVVRMDANTENLKGRLFKIPLLRPYVMEHRPQLLVDALTVIKAYHAATDVPPMPVQMQSFEAWSHFCREPLIWLGLPDPVITQQHETDDGRASAGALFKALYTHFADRPFTSVDVARIVNGISDTGGELAAAMMQDGCAEPNSPLKVGYWLRSRRDRISAGLKLVHAGNACAGARWKFQRIGEELTNG